MIKLLVNKFPLGSTLLDDDGQWWAKMGANFGCLLSRLLHKKLGVIRVIHSRYFWYKFPRTSLCKSPGRTFVHTIRYDTSALVIVIKRMSQATPSSFSSFHPPISWATRLTQYSGHPSRCTSASFRHLPVAIAIAKGWRSTVDSAVLLLLHHQPPGPIAMVSCNMMLFAE